MVAGPRSGITPTRLSLRAKWPPSRGCPTHVPGNSHCEMVPLAAVDALLVGVCVSLMARVGEGQPEIVRDQLDRIIRLVR